MTSLSAKLEGYQAQPATRSLKSSRCIDGDIFASLYTRARAWQLWPEAGFYDEVATIVLERLGENLQSFCTTPADECRCLARSKWFDQRCRHFFKKYPTGMCIDLGAGLNTRFHRLSRSADWPQFKWADLDIPEVISLKASIFPKTENYRLVSADLTTDEWLSSCGWQMGTPLIITLEGVLMHLPERAVKRLFEQIATHCQGNSATEIVFDYISPQRWLYSRLVHFFRHHFANRQGRDSYFSFKSGYTSAANLVRDSTSFQIFSDCSLRNSDGSFVKNMYQVLAKKYYLWRYAHLALRQKLPEAEVNL